MEKIKHFTSKLNTMFSYISIIALIVIMLMMVCDISLRYLFNAPILGSYEMVEFLMVIVVFFSFAYTQEIKGHVRVTMLIEKLPKRIEILLEAINYLLGSIILGIMAYAAFLQAAKIKIDAATSSVLFIPIYPFEYLLGVGAVLFAITLFIDFIISLKSAIVVID